MFLRLENFQFFPKGPVLARPGKNPVSDHTLCLRCSPFLLGQLEVPTNCCTPHPPGNAQATEGTVIGQTVSDSGHLLG